VTDTVFPIPALASQRKAELRAAALDRRSQVAPAIRAAFASRIAAEGLRLAGLWRPRVVSAFFSIRGEPDTSPLLSALAGSGFATALPVTAGAGEPLVFRLWRPGDATSAGAMKIPEPVRESPQVEPDMLFVPLSVFDRRGHRIGFGAGHYDRTLAALSARGPIRTIGVAFSVSEISEVPTEPHDRPLDLILTENELIDPRGALR
jgi:5-formyltetrahydrofolate cyclo-ligase